MHFTDLVAMLARLAGDLLILILLYDFFVQPFRFYSMDALTQFVWVAARKVCYPFDRISRMVVRLPDRDLTPLFTLIIVVFCRGLIYAACAGATRPSLGVIAIGIDLSFYELFSRIVFPALLFLIYADIQLSRHQDTFVGNVLVMTLHDVAKRFIVAIRKLLPSYHPWHVFATVFVLLALCDWAVTMIAFLPFADTDALTLFPQGLLPPIVAHVDSPFLSLFAVYVYFAEKFLFGIFILILMNMLAGFSGLDPYDRFSVLLGLVISPWLILSRRLFPWARIGMFDLSIAILLLIPYFILSILKNLLV